MPIRKINFTERVRITHAAAVVTVGMDENKASPWFDASIDLSRHHFPEGALVFVEAYRQTPTPPIPVRDGSPPARARGLPIHGRES